MRFFLYAFLCGAGAMPAVAQEMMTASYYGAGEKLNERMANGQRFDGRDATTAAHRTLPLGTRLRVKNPQNGRSLTVVVKDRGPFVKGRQLDLSYGAAQALGFAHQGVARLFVEVAGGMPQQAERVARRKRR